MKHTTTDYPIGATWECIDENGKIGRIWLDDRREYFEVWYWSVCWDDGSGQKFDWNASYRACKNEIPVYGRFKRVNQSPHQDKS